MSDRNRLKFARLYCNLIHNGFPRKQALVMVQQEIKLLNPLLPRSRVQIYAWCRKFKLSTR